MIWFSKFFFPFALVLTSHALVRLKWSCFRQELAIGEGLKIKAAVVWGALMSRDAVNHLHSPGSQGIIDSSLSLHS